MLEGYVLNLESWWHKKASQRLRRLSNCSYLYRAAHSLLLVRKHSSVSFQNKVTQRKITELFQNHCNALTKLAPLQRAQAFCDAERRAQFGEAVLGKCFSTKCGRIVTTSTKPAFLLAEAWDVLVGVSCLEGTPFWSA